MSTAPSTLSGNESESKRLLQATQHVSQLWFPVNEELYSKIQKGLADGIYDLDIDFLVNEIRSDFALFTYCLKEVSKRAARDGRSFPESATPLEMLKIVGLPQLREILSVERQRISAHSLSTMTDLQTTRLQEAMLSASAAEVLAENKKIDPDLGFSAGLLRQLGAALVAWNYPTVYRRVASALKPGERLDDALNLTLGFSPTMLATALARQWRLSPEVRSAMGDSEVSSVSERESGEIAETLKTICAVGEALARANDPEHYPTAEADWRTAKEEIEKTLGYEGFGLIEQRAAENCQNYLKLAPEIFPNPIVLDPESKIHKAQEQVAADANQYLRHLTPPVKKRFRELYLQIEAQSVSKETVRSLVRDLIPLCGFTGCAVYTIDLETMKLVPRIKTGSVELREVNTLVYKDGDVSADPVIAALKCTNPIIEVGYGKSGELQLLAACLGEKQKVGVLYLEAPIQPSEEGKQILLQTFKAVRQTLCDCLKVQ